MSSFMKYKRIWTYRTFKEIMYFRMNYMCYFNTTSVRSIMK